MYKIRNWGNTLKKELKGMKSTKTKKIRREDIPNLETSERVKYEIAEELGLLDKDSGRWLEESVIKRNRADRRNHFKKIQEE